MQQWKVSAHAFFKMASQWPSSPRVSLPQNQTTPISRENQSLALVFGISRFLTYLLERSSSSKRTTNLSKWIGGKHSGVHHHTYSGYSSKSRDTSVTFATNLENTWCYQTHWVGWQILEKLVPSLLIYWSIDLHWNRGRTQHWPHVLRPKQKGGTPEGNLKWPCPARLMATREVWMARFHTGMPTALGTFWPYRDELGVAHGVLFKGWQVVIPSTMQDAILNQLHVGHIGIEQTLRLVRETVFRPNILKDIERITNTCAACQELQPKQQKEPLQPHDIPTAPWTKLGTDLFVLNREYYLLITDYHSKFPLVYTLQQSCRGDHEWGLQPIRSTRRNNVRHWTTVPRTTIQEYVSEMDHHSQDLVSTLPQVKQTGRTDGPDGRISP